MTPDEPQDHRGRSFEETLSDPLNESESVAASQPDAGNTAQPDPPLRDMQSLEFARPTDANAISDTTDNVALDVNLSEADALDLNLSEADAADLNVRPIISQENGSLKSDQIIEFPSLNVADATSDNQIRISATTDGPAVKLPFNQSLSLPASTSAPAQTLVITPTGENGAMVRTAAAVTDALPQTAAVATVAVDTETLSPKAAADADTADRPTLSTKAADTADYRALAASSSSSPAERLKLVDTPSQITSALANSDTPVPAKSSPLMTVLPTLSPLTGMSDRLAATIMQTTQAQPTVTLDKLPQTVVAIALSARSATLQIDPPELGRIQLDYQFDSQGRTVVTLTPESDAARAALMDRMASIIAALEQGSDKPIDVLMGNARDFGSEFDQTSQDDRGSGSNTKDGTKPVASDHAPSHDPQRFMRAPTGEAERLHILV